MLSRASPRLFCNYRSVILALAALLLFLNKLSLALHKVKYSSHLSLIPTFILSFDGWWSHRHSNLSPPPYPKGRFPTHVPLPPLWELCSHFFLTLAKCTRRYLPWHHISKVMPADPQWLGYSIMQRCIMGRLGQLNQYLQIWRNPPSRPKRYSFDVFHTLHGNPKPGKLYPVLPITVSSGLCSSWTAECIINSETGPRKCTAHGATLRRETWFGSCFSVRVSRMLVLGNSMISDLAS